MTKLPSFEHSLTSGAPLAAPMDSASALAPSAKAGPYFDRSKPIMLSCCFRVQSLSRLRSGSARGAGDGRTSRELLVASPLSTTQSLAATNEGLKNGGQNDD